MSAGSAALKLLSAEIDPRRPCALTMARGVGRVCEEELSIGASLMLVLQLLPREILTRKIPRTLPQDIIASPNPTSTLKQVSDAQDSLFSVAPAWLPSVYVELSEPFAPRKTDPSPNSTLVALDPTVFNHPLRRDILHLCIVQYRDGLRQGTASTKTRGEVAGSGRKIRPQKGTGRARLGDAQSPMLRGGGVAFGPKPRDFSTKLPRKIIDMGMRVALSQKLKEQALGVMPHLDWSVPKTAVLARRLQTLQMTNTLFVTGDSVPAALQRAIANIPHVDAMASSELKIWDILKWKRIVLDSQAIKDLEDRLKRSPNASKCVAPPPIARNSVILRSTF